MKVILLRDVAKIGRRHSIVDVPDGFAQNKLIPRGEAVLATPANEKRLATLAVKQQAKTNARQEELKQVSEMTTTAPLAIEMEANKEGHLFRAVSAKEVVAGVKVRGFSLDQGEVEIPSPIKALGAHTIYIVSKGLRFPLNIEVKPR